MIMENDWEVGVARRWACLVGKGVANRKVGVVNWKEAWLGGGRDLMEGGGAYAWLRKG